MKNPTTQRCKEVVLRTQYEILYQTPHYYYTYTTTFWWPPFTWVGVGAYCPRGCLTALLSQCPRQHPHGDSGGAWQGSRCRGRKFAVKIREGKAGSWPAQTTIWRNTYIHTYKHSKQYKLINHCTILMH